MPDSVRNKTSSYSRTSGTERLMPKCPELTKERSIKDAPRRERRPTTKTFVSITISGRFIMVLYITPKVKSMVELHQDL
ncbi:MAG: hypothetical protein RBS57_09700, partial [Desulforhabdus sp.]|nr:hypothetical protein [Desulforhabdus sp.]